MSLILKKNILNNMKKVILSLSFLLSIVLISFSQNTNDKSKLEPKTNFELFINGHKYIVSEGEELKLDTTFTKPVISIKEAEYKKFENQSFSFQYPKNYIYSFEQDFGYKNWTLTYNNLVVMIFEIDAKTTLNEILEETIKKLGKKNCKVSDIKKRNRT